MTALSEFLEHELAKPYRDGETDCSNTADRWVQLNRGFSPLGEYGRPVRNTQDVQGWLSERFGLAGAALRVMRLSGLERTLKPQAGDIGLVIIKKEICMAIFTGRVWFSRNERGVMLGKADAFVRAWSV